MCDGIPKHYDVLYIVSLKANLLNISQLYNKELTVNFLKQGCASIIKSSYIMIIGYIIMDSCYGISYQGDQVCNLSVISNMSL